MPAEFRLLIHPELQAQTGDTSLRTGLRAIAEGREDEYGAERLGNSPDTFDLRDCTQLKVGGHILIYREFDDRAATREAVCFEHDNAYEVAAQRLGRMAVRPDPGLVTYPKDPAWNPAPAWRAVIDTPNAPTASTFRHHSQHAAARQR